MAAPLLPARWTGNPFPAFSNGWRYVPPRIHTVSPGAIRSCWPPSAEVMSQGFALVPRPFGLPLGETYHSAAELTLPLVRKMIQPATNNVALNLASLYFAIAEVLWGLFISVFLHA